MVRIIQISFATLLILFCIAIATGLVTGSWVVIALAIMGAMLSGMISRN